jgi:hypothetical protein
MESISQKIVSDVTYGAFGDEIIISFEDMSKIKLSISQSCCEFSAFYKPNLDKLIGHHIMNIDLVQGVIPFVFKHTRCDSDWGDRTHVIEENIIYSSRYESCEVKTYRIFMDNNEYIDLYLFTLSNGYYSGYLELSDEDNKHIYLNYSRINSTIL